MLVVTTKQSLEMLVQLRPPARLCLNIKPEIKLKTIAYMCLLFLQSLSVSSDSLHPSSQLKLSFPENLVELLGATGAQLANSTRLQNMGLLFSGKEVKG